MANPAATKTANPALTKVLDDKAKAVAKPVAPKAAPKAAAPAAKPAAPAKPVAKAAAPVAPKKGPKVTHIDHEGNEIEGPAPAKPVIKPGAAKPVLPKIGPKVTVKAAAAPAPAATPVTRATVDARVLRATDKAATLKEREITKAVCDAFGTEGKTIADVVEEMKLTFKAPRSKVWETDPRAHLMPYFSFAVTNGYLEEVAQA